MDSKKLRYFRSLQIVKADKHHVASEVTRRGQ
jgi:hypothetical protein